MPEKRPSDNVKLSVDFPQEDEFAVGNMFPMAYYYFFHFPDQYARFYQEFARLQVRPARRRRWQSNYQKLLAKALLNTQKPRAVFKNPVNTVRLPILLEMYPEARFIYLYRNPIVVYLSTKKFFLSLFPTLQFQSTTESQIVSLILDVFVKMYRDYEADKARLQPARLLEISFEEFEKDPMGHLEMIYDQLQLSDFAQARPFFEAYIRSQESYEKTATR
ncbi:MAG: sulfotransferase [Microscillaceae bacterium]|nr:sulfotransferase [Microscillaceae bacterium]